MSDLTCGQHRAYAYSRGGRRRLFELTPLSLVRWNRIRDDISHAEVVVPSTDCCGMLDDLRTILNELHIYRNGKPVWQGPITRLEYEYDNVRIFAEDVLWATKRAVVNPGFTHHGKANLTLDIFDMLLNQCYSRQNDPWNMLHTGQNLEGTHLHPIRTPREPKTFKTTATWQDTIFNDLDGFADNHGIDYTVVNRDIYYWDIHWEWKRLPPLDEDWITDRIRVVEYGNSCYTRAIVTNGRGYAGVDRAGDDVCGRNQYGFLDNVIGGADETDTANKPSADEIHTWQERALRNLNNTYPAPVGVVVPANTTLLPGAPWNVDDLIPGAWFKVNIKRVCRKVVEWNRLHEVVVEETPQNGETINISAVSAPREHHVVPT